MITREGDWTPEERILLESQLLQATQGPLCLDPSPSVSMAAIRARQQGLQLSPASLRRVTRKFSQARAPHPTNSTENSSDICIAPIELPKVSSVRRHRSMSYPMTSCDTVDYIINSIVEIESEQETEEIEDLITNVWGFESHFKNFSRRCKSY
jgi:hypothetical protein